MADIITRIYAFNGSGAPDASWTPSIPSGGAITESGGQLVLTTTTGGSGEEVTQLDDVTAYNFADGQRTYIYCDLPLGTEKYAQFAVLDGSGNGAGFRLNAAGNLNRRSWAAGVPSNESSVSYDPVNHKWLSFRRSGTDIILETAALSGVDPDTFGAPFTIGGATVDFANIKHRIAAQHDFQGAAQIIYFDGLNTSIGAGGGGGSAIAAISSGYHQRGLR